MWYGKDVIKIGRFFASSKTCECGVKNNDLKLSDRVWTCKSCGRVNQRDLLAANNILKEGRRSLGDFNERGGRGYEACEAFRIINVID